MPSFAKSSEEVVCQRIFKAALAMFVSRMSVFAFEKAVKLPFHSRNIDDVFFFSVFLHHFRRRLLNTRR
jgi:branched-subunit amino acid transport protein